MKITGILDWEWAMGGDPEFEFRIFFSNRYTKIKGIDLVSFIEGYMHVRILSKNFCKKLKIYFIFEYLRFLYIAYIYFKDRKAKEYFIKKIHYLLKNF
jgi:aminoglycoside phosphotransferase (APT) family kinase protein